jgi:hypothetical protein
MAGGYGSGAKPAATPAPAPAATGKPGEAAPAQAAAAAPVKESVNFRSDELSRIVSLVQYR